MTALWAACDQTLNQLNILLDTSASVLFFYANLNLDKPDIFVLCNDFDKMLHNHLRKMQLRFYFQVLQRDFVLAIDTAFGHPNIIR